MFITIDSWIIRPLVVDDIVRIKALIPGAVSFDYVDEEKLDINVETASALALIKQKGDIFKLNEKGDSAVSMVLYFEFVDGELRPKLNRDKGDGSSL
jgi:DEAD/DEAH box helicase domain-containing protein